MRLIDDTATKIDIWDLFNSTYNDGSRFTEEETEFAKRILSDVQTKIENQPTAFDLESVIAELEEKSLEHAINGQQYGEDGYCFHENREQYLKQGIDIAIAILNSAVNSTSEKIGG